jgi:hypothetical protein
VWQVGLDARTAREKLRVAKALVQFPLISAAMRVGHLSYSKVRAITRVVAAETERSLVDMALAGTTNHVERIVAAYRRATPCSDEADAEADGAAWAARGLTHRLNDNGTMTITLTVPVEPGVAYLSAVETFAAPATPDIDGRIESRQARLATRWWQWRRRRSPLPMASEPAASRGSWCSCTGEGVRDRGHRRAAATPLGCHAPRPNACHVMRTPSVLHADDGEVTGISSRASVIRGRLRRLILARDRCAPSLVVAGVAGRDPPLPSSRQGGNKRR